MTSHAIRRRSVRRLVLATLILFGLFGGTVYAIIAWKRHGQAKAAAAAAHQPEPAETVESALARTRSYSRSTTAIGTVRALQSITLRNELSGTVREVLLEPGQLVAAGDLLVALDVTVEQAELAALDAEARVAASMLTRLQQALQSQGASAADVDRAQAEHDKAVANVARSRALIERKRIRAPFPARVGMVDLHPGQYLDPGTPITTLQGVDEAVHVEFSVTQEAATTLAIGAEVEVSGNPTANAKIVAIDAQVDSATRNTWIRALLQGAPHLPAPGSSVRVRVPVEAPHEVIVVPVSALRRSPGGDLVYVLEQSPDGALRAKTRRVAAGAPIGDEIVVTEGLAVGERVAAAGSFKLREGVLVHDKTPATKQ